MMVVKRLQFIIVAFMCVGFSFLLFGDDTRNTRASDTENNQKAKKSEISSNSIGNSEKSDGDEEGEIQEVIEVILPEDCDESECFEWEQFYDFRKEFVYPLNSLVNNVTLGMVNPLRDLRLALGYDTVPGGIMCAQWGVGIADAMLAAKPAEDIVRDDVIRALGYVVLYKSMQAGGKVVARKMRLETLLPRSGMLLQALAFGADKVLVTASRKIGCIIVDPFAYLAYYTVKANKKTWWGSKKQTQKPKTKKSATATHA